MKHRCHPSMKHNPMKNHLVYTCTTAAATLAATVLICVAPPVQAQTATPVREVLVANDAVVLRAAPKVSAPQQALLWQGERLEVRGERLGFLQVWDHQRERGGYVSAELVRSVGTGEADAPALLAVLRFVKDNPGSEGLTFGYGTAWMQAASAAQVVGPAGVEVVDAMAVAAVRLAQRASTPRASASAQTATLAQLDAAKRYGLRFTTNDDTETMRVCYDGALFQQVLALPAATGEQRARAVLALAQDACSTAGGGLLAQVNQMETTAALLDTAQANGLSPVLKNQLHLQRASTWSAVAFERARKTSPKDAAQAASKALDELASVQGSEMPEALMEAWNNAVMRVGASRWAALPAAGTSAALHGLQLENGPGTTEGEVCVRLLAVAARKGGAAQKTDTAALAVRCTHGLPWLSSFSVNRTGTAAVLAVQPMAGWQELWILRKQGATWAIAVLPPGSVSPGLGYAEWAGWTPDGKQALVARESRGDGRYQRSYEVVDLITLATVRRSSDPKLLGAFQRWQSPSWVHNSVSLR